MLGLVSWSMLSVMMLNQLFLIDFLCDDQQACMFKSSHALIRDRMQF